MSFNRNAVAQSQAPSIQSLYLNPNKADVFFIINGERIPGHKFLGVTCPYDSTMFHEGDEVDMNDANLSAESFKEFLKFFYFVESNLTMDNIEGVIGLAKRSSSDQIFVACENFLKTSVTIDTMFFCYQLALLYDANNLKVICEYKICVNAENMLHSSSFLEFPCDFLRNVLKCDALACEEIDIFKACMAWARAACRRNNLNSSNVEHLRSLLRDSIYQIRFTSMTNEDVATCIRSCPGLFTADELQEIICMVAHKDEFQPKQFNWNSRYFNLEKGRHLVCSRFEHPFTVFKYYKLKNIEVTSFVCNRRVLLNGFWCELDERNFRSSIQVIINEMKTNENCNERYNQRLTANFTLHRTDDSYETEIQLNKSILLRPNYTYEICITFDVPFPIYRSISSRSILKQKVRLDHDIVFNFDKRGIVSVLSISRFDNKNYFQKVICNPNMWKWTIIAAVTAYFCYSSAPKIKSLHSTSHSNILCQELFKFKKFF